jgi:hypothetical protein
MDAAWPTTWKPGSRSKHRRDALAHGGVILHEEDPYVSAGRVTCVAREDVEADPGSRTRFASDVEVAVDQVGRYCIPLMPDPAAGGVWGSKPRPSSVTSTQSCSPASRASTRIWRAPEWRRALTSASPTMRRISVPLRPSGPAGTPSATFRRISPSTAGSLLTSTSAARSSANGRSSSPPNPQIVDRAPQLLARPLKQRPHPSQPLRCLWVSQIRARTSSLGQGVGQILERLVVEVASDSLSLVLSNLDQTLLGLCACHRRGDHVRHTLKEVEVVRGYVVWRSPARRR